MGTAACAPSMFTSVLAMPTLSVWRCKNTACRPGWRPSRLILRLEYDGRSILEHKCSCNTKNRLPDDAEYLRREE